MLKKNRAHNQYSARLTRWLDRLSHVDVNIQYTAGKNIPLTHYLSRHPIIPTKITELEKLPSKADGQNEAEADEEFVVNQICGIFEFNRARGSIKRLTEQTIARESLDQSQRDENVRERNSNTHFLETSSPYSSANSVDNNSSNSNRKMDKVNGIDMIFIYKKGTFPQKQNACGLNETTY